MPDPTTAASAARFNKAAEPRPRPSRVTFLILTVIALGGCAKESERSKRVASPPSVAQQFLQLHGEAIQLLAIKHRIPPVVAGKVAWEYYKRHDVRTTLMLYVHGQKQEVPDFEKLGEQVIISISEIAAQFSLEKEVVASFIADLRLSEARKK